MTIVSTDASASWQGRVCFVAAAVFSLAAGGTNLIYGWSKGTDLPSSLVWAGVSLGVSVIFALSWPAFIVSLDRRQWARSVMVLVALVVTGIYSISAALGSASGGRMAAAAEEQSTTDAKKKAQTAYDAAQTELASIPASRPASELQVLIAADETELASLPSSRPVAQLQQLASSPRFSQDCAAVNGSLRVVCPRNPNLQAELDRALKRQKLQEATANLKAELARSERRQKLAGDAEAAAAKLEKIGPSKVANTDAAALAMYLQALGMNAQADTINRLLVLLAVVTIECGGGLSLAVGMALSETSGQASRSGAMDRASVHPERTLSERPNERPNASPERDQELDREINRLERSLALNDPPERSAHGRVLEAISKQGGVLFGGQAALGAAFGWSKTRMNEVLHELQAAGRVKLHITRQGTAVRLVAIAA